MIDIGLIGNCHTGPVSRTLNIAKKIPGMRVTHILGTTMASAKEVAAAGQIPHIIRKPEDLIGQVDAAYVGYVHGKYNLPAARPLLEAGLPLFIDKPFCYRLAEGKRFLTRARELHVPVCSFSVLPKQASFVELRKKARRLGRIRLVVSTTSYGLTTSKGGIFHDVIHPLDMLLRLSGYAVSHVQVVRGSGKTLTATLSYSDGTAATMNLVPQVPLHLGVIGEKGRVDQPIDYDEDVYLTGIRDFCRMFRTGKTKETQQTILGPIAVLEAMEKSLAVGRKIRIPKILC